MMTPAIGRYELFEQLGAGGMGVVYRARDTKLDRYVALKVLPAGLLADAGARKRFRKEAMALSRLNHPNIATVHDFDSAEGVDFIVMELVGGTALDTCVSGGPLPEDRLMSVSVQLAEGVSAAHSSGVLHKDLKPANLRLTPDGRLKILDFGLATLVRQSTTPNASTAHLSEAGTTGGTLPYMAPEQFAGKSDERTDIYQTGMVLYELATGRRAFDNKQQPAELMHDILQTNPPLPRAVNPRIPQALELVIVKAIDKSPDLRYQSAREMLVDLQRAFGRPATLPSAATPRRTKQWFRPAIAATVVIAALVGGLIIRRASEMARATAAESIAVLPFANESNDRANDFFSDAMTYEIITQLGKISNLRVTSRTSVVQYRGSSKPIAQIAKELGVGRIVEGSVLRAGQRVRVTVSLVDGAADRQIWSESYERELHDVLALQGEIARAVAAEVRVRVTPQEAERLQPPKHVDPRAQEEYLRGVYQQVNMPMNPMMARQHFERAIQLDPTYAAPYAGLAESLVSIGFFINPMAPMQVFPKIKELSMKAISMNESIASAHVSLGVARLHSEWDWAGAERDFQRAIQLNPSWAPAHHWYAHLLLARDRIDESVAESERASELDPDNVMWGSCVGWHCLYARKYDDAILRLVNIIRKTPNQFLAYLYLGRAYDAVGRHEEAIAAFRNSANLSGQSATVLAALAYAYGHSGKRAEAEDILQRLTKRSQTEYVSAYDFAVIQAGLGNTDQAFAWLEKAYMERSAWLAHIKWDERFSDLRADPRFTALVRRIGLPV